MKRLKESLLLLALSCCTSIFAQMPADFEVDGISYGISSEEKLEVSVVAGTTDYQGDIVLPATVSHAGKTWQVTQVDDYAFETCRELTSIDLGAVQTVGEFAFHFCSALEKVNLGAVRSLEARAFADCAQLKDIDLKDVTFIGNGAFMGCKELKDIDLTSVQTLMLYAFSGCTGLTTVDLAALRKLQPQTFKGCSALAQIDFREVESIGNGNFENCTALETVDLKAVKKVGDRAFMHCTALREVQLNQTESLGEFAFWECPALSAVRLTTSVPPHFNGKESDPYIYFFDEPVYRNATLYVPAGSKAVYEAAPVWKNFKNIVEDDETTALSEVTAEAVTLSVDGSTLSIAGAPRGTALRVYTSDGVLVAQAVAPGSPAKINLPAGKVYILKVGELSYKISL